MGIRDTIARTILGERAYNTERVTTALLNEIRRRPAMMMTPESMVQTISEFDPRMADLLLRQIQNTNYRNDYTNEDVRRRVVEQSRNAYVWDVITQSIIDLWTSYGFQSNVTVTIDNPSAQQVWDEFYQAQRNACVLGTRNIYVLSQEVLVAGEVFFVNFINRSNGEVTLRYFESESIREVVTLSNDKNIPLWYINDGVDDDGTTHEMYYPDWRAEREQLDKQPPPQGIGRADDENASDIDGLTVGTTVKIIHAAHRKKGKSRRGFPLMTAGIAWSDAYKTFLENRATVARAVATYVDKVTAKNAGSRAIDSIVANLQSSFMTNPTGGVDTNPAPVAGSTWVQNDKIDRERMSLTTGAADAEKDGASLLSQAGLAGGVYPHYLGRGETFRLATATAMEQPVLRNFNAYQLFWSSVWKDIARVVLDAKEEYGGANYGNYQIDVSMDPIITTDPAEIKSSADMLVELSDRGLVNANDSQKMGDELMKLSFNKLGIDISEMFKDIEAGESQRPFGIKMSEYGIGDYESAIRGFVHGLWAGNITTPEFYDAMQTSIERGLARAWKSAQQIYGIEDDELDQDEIILRDDFILQQAQYINGFAEFVRENSKANGKPLSSVMARMNIWVNMYNQMMNLAMVTLSKNQKLEWVLGPTEKHCNDCAKYNGRVYRGRTWEAWGIRPQSNDLSCKGYNCLCQLVPTDKPSNKGKPPAMSGG